MNRIKVYVINEFVQKKIIRVKETTWELLNGKSNQKDKSKETLTAYFLSQSF